jgi:hypothetical protein
LRFAAFYLYSRFCPPPVADGDFSVLIPKIALNAPVLVNVDPASPPAYRATLKEGWPTPKAAYCPAARGRCIF